MAARWMMTVSGVRWDRSASVSRRSSSWKAKPERDAEPPATPRALLVEDNPTNQFVARRFIEKAGCVVDEVMKDMSPAAIDRVEALAAGDQAPNEADMLLMERIERISKGARPPSAEAAIAAECRL